MKNSPEVLGQLTRHDAKPKNDDAVGLADSSEESKPILQTSTFDRQPLEDIVGNIEGNTLAVLCKLLLLVTPDTYHKRWVLGTINLFIEALIAFVLDQLRQLVEPVER